MPKEIIKTFNDANALRLTHIDEIVVSNPFDLYDSKKYYTLHLNYLLDERKNKTVEYFLQVIRNEFEPSAHG